MQDKGQLATLGAGCFWCVEAVFQQLKGVRSVISGYMGGESKDPTYREVCSGLSGHAEVAQVNFNPDEISYEDLLKVFWSTHDPTTLNQQGHDRGTQYRSVIFYHSEEQKMIAERSKSDAATQVWTDPIVTEIAPVTEFYAAENYHQNYYEHNPNQGYCRTVIAPKMAKFRKQFVEQLKSAKTNA